MQLQNGPYEIVYDMDFISKNYQNTTIEPESMTSKPY